MPPDTLLDTALQQLRNAFENGGLQILTFGTGIMVTIGLLQICLATVYAFPGIWDHPVRYFFDIIRRLLPVFLIFAFLPRLQGLGQEFFDEFEVFASGLAGTLLTPSAIFDRWALMVSTIAKSRSVGMWIIGALNLEDLYFAVFCLIVIITGGAISWRWLFVQIQAVAYAVCAPVILCWAPLDEAWNSAMSWIQQTVALGVKTIALAMVLGGILLLAQTWQNTLSIAPINFSRPYYETITMVEALLSLYLVHEIPNLVANLVVFGGRHSTRDDAYNSAAGGLRKLIGKLGV